MLGWLVSKSRLEGSSVFCILFLYVVAIVLLFGTRFEVGQDWFSYIRVYERLVENPWSFDDLEIGYKFLNVLSYYAGWGILGVVFMATLLLMSFTMWGAWSAGLNPFYFFAAVAPYHFVMSGMNLTTQSIALGISVLAFSRLISGRLLSYCFLVVFASLFHSSAILLIALAFYKIKKRYIVFIASFLASVAYFFSRTVYSQYFDTTMDNAGIYLRVGFVFVASIFILINIGKVRSMGFGFYRLCMVSVFSVPVILLVAFLSTTMADRFSYYFILLSAMLVMRLGINSDARFLSNYGGLALFASSFVAFSLWVAFSSYTQSYIYKSYLFG